MGVRPRLVTRRSKFLNPEFFGKSSTAGPPNIAWKSTDYCDKVCLTLRERLLLFLPVCQAVQHAHQKGVIHRYADRRLFTWHHYVRTSHRLQPPEKQRFQDAAWQEILRLIKEGEPTKPSTKVSGSTSLPNVVVQRGLEPAQLSRAMRGDLDWNVMKSLEKERSRRYETANGLARDIERYLSDQTVEATPPSLSYRFRKFARRNRIVLTTAVLVSAALMAGTVVSTWQAFRAHQAETLVGLCHFVEVPPGWTAHRANRQQDADETTLQKDRSNRRSGSCLTTF